MRFLGLFIALVLFGCGEDSSTPDAQMSNPDAKSVDAMSVDAMIDAVNPCPGGLELELRVADWESDANLFDVAVQIEGGDLAMSAPNGRVVVCVGQTGAISFTLTHADYLPRVHTMNAEHVAAQRENNVAPTFRLMTSATRQSLYSGVKLIFDPQDTTVIVMTDSAIGAPRAGVSATLGKIATNAFIPGNSPLVLNTGNTSAADGLILFLNTTTDPGQSPLSLITPAGCQAPPTFTVAVGISSVSSACP